MKFREDRIRSQRETVLAGQESNLHLKHSKGKSKELEAEPQEIIDITETPKEPCLSGESGRPGKFSSCRVQAETPNSSMS
jgi:hypothetical protein